MAATALAALLTTALPSGPALAASPPDLAALSAAALQIGPGSSGALVVVLQDTLNDWGQTSPVDGQFSNATGTAVAALADQLDPAAAGLQTQLALVGFGPRALVLSSGDQGPAVAALQRALTRAGYGVGASGTFGPQTQQEVSAFQTANGLPINGEITVWEVEAVAGAAAAPLTAEGAAAPTPSASVSAEAVVALADSLNGRAYAWGGGGPWSFDCSGLTAYVFGRAAGVSLPHDSFAQWDLGTSVPAGALQAGDLVFFNTSGPGPSHVGVYVGGAAQDFVNATDPGGGVQVDSLYNDYWGRHYVGARQVLA